jgi:signal transduction histidine kinase/CheY-like chemotaxis protein
VTPEEQRLAALRRYDLPDLPAEPELEAIMRIAATVAGVPTSTINLLDSTLQCQYVTAGFEGGNSPRSDAMCEVVLREGHALHVPDASVDPRFASNPWVDGRMADVRFYAATPLVTEDGYTLGTLCVFDAVTRELTSDQRAALDDLAGQVMALLERRRLTRRAEEATRAKSAFLAEVSHEIRTPMNGVLGMLDLLLGTDLTPEQRQHALLAHRSADTLLSLLDDVLDLSKGEAGHVVLTQKPFAPGDLVQDVVEVLSSVATVRGLDVTTAVAPDLPVLDGDPGRLRQVLVNLVGNALKFTVRGGVTVRASYDEALLLEVQDTGVGISADDLPLLFEPFQQGAAGREHGGTGLGLVICRELVGLMGGEITVASEIGVGSTFTVRLPLPLHAERDTPQDLAGLSVLVVDDGEVNRMVAVGMLHMLGAAADAVESGEAALGRALVGDYDVILLDHVMPGMDGPATARALTSAGVQSRLVGLTGTTLPEDLAACKEAGMDLVLSKPLRPEDLLSHLS